jgi:hypothetical protein
VRVVEGIGGGFTEVQQAITEDFLPALSRYLDENDIRRLSEFSVKQSGLAYRIQPNQRRRIMKLALVLTLILSLPSRVANHFGAGPCLPGKSGLRSQVARRRLTTSP